MASAHAGGARPWARRMVFRHAGTPARAVVSLISLAAVVRSSLFAYSYFVSPAWFDLWRWVDDFQLWADGHYTFHDLIKPHYEHRIATTRVLLLLDSIFFDMNGRLPVMANQALLAVLGVQLWRISRLDGVSDTAWDAPPLFWVALMGSVCQVLNVILPFQVQFAITCLAASAAAAWLTQAAGARRARAARLAAGAGLSAILAIFSMGSGILLWPAMMVLLALRRAAVAVWAIFVPLAALGAASFFYHYTRQTTGTIGLFAWHETRMRILYIVYFVGSVANDARHLAICLGAGGMLVFGVVAAVRLRAAIARREALPAGDAALIAIGVFVLLSGAAATLTPRMLFGPQAALVSRYATMSLLFTAATFGLCLRWGWHARWPAWAANFVLPAAAILILYCANRPSFDFAGAGLRRAVTAQAQFLVNNVGVEGPIRVDFLAGLDHVRSEIVFLHARHLNMFSPENGPPADLLARVRAADPAALPPCRGYIDDAYAIDSTGFLVVGWAADAAGQHNPPWIAALDRQGTLLGTSRALAPRMDVRQALGSRNEFDGFEAGFRMAGAARGAQGAADVRILGLFPGAAKPLCTMPMKARIGPVPIEPAAELDAVSPAAVTVKSDGFAAEAAAGPPAGVTAWGTSPGTHPGAPRSLVFHLAPQPWAGRALAVPFSVGGETPGRICSFVLADGTRFAARLPSAWDRRTWRAAVLPAELMARHGAAVSVQVTAGDDRGLLVGSPVLATTRAEWSRLF